MSQGWCDGTGSGGREVGKSEGGRMDGWVPRLSALGLLKHVRG